VSLKVLKILVADRTAFRLAGGLLHRRHPGRASQNRREPQCGVLIFVEINGRGDCTLISAGFGGLSGHGNLLRLQLPSVEGA
jgi:hypothetical protein